MQACPVEAVKTRVDEIFTDCDENGDDSLRTTEIKECYDNYCYNECEGASLDAIAAQTGNWCECVNYDYGIVVELYDSSDPADREFSFAEFELMFNADFDFQIDWPSRR